MIAPAIAYVHPETGDVVGLSESDALALLERHPELDHQYRRWSAQAGGRGRMIVIDEKITAALARGEFAPYFRPEQETQ